MSDDVKEDLLQPFFFDRLPVRGAIVRLENQLTGLLKHQVYPAALGSLLAESAAGTLLISNAMKFTGRLTLQISGAGPLDMLVMQARDTLEFRGMAALANSPADATALDYATMTRDAQCRISINSANQQERYQGIVEVVGATLAETLTAFFKRSVQLPTQLGLYGKSSMAGGVILQVLGGNDGFVDSDDWHRLGLMIETLSLRDFQENSCVGLLGKLFAEDDLRLADARAIHAHCDCNDAKAREALALLGRDDALLAVEEQGGLLQVRCEYCGIERHFDGVDVAAIFGGSSIGDQVSGPH